jgi:hypothetical protein
MHTSMRRVVWLRQPRASSLQRSVIVVSCVAVTV